MRFEIKPKGNSLTNFLTKITRLRGDIPKAAEIGAEDIAQQAVSWITTYPPESEGNRPPVPFWIRGVGRQTGRAIDPVSQRYGQSWDMRKVRSGPLGTIIRVFTNTTYAQWIADRRTQARFHRSRGWRTIQAASEKFSESGFIINIISKKMVDVKRKFDSS